MYTPTPDQSPAQATERVKRTPGASERTKRWIAGRWVNVISIGLLGASFTVPAAWPGISGEAEHVHTSSLLGIAHPGPHTAAESETAATRRAEAQRLLLEAQALVDEALVLPAGLPVQSSVRSTWGMRMHPIKRRMLPHHGIDLRCSVGTSVRSTADGIVIDQGSGGGAGRWIRVQHGDGYGTFYAHLDSSLVEIGDAVMNGEKIAHSGETGAVTGPHLHYELNWGGGRSDSLSLPVDALVPLRDSLLNHADALIEQASILR